MTAQSLEKPIDNGKSTGRSVARTFALMLFGILAFLAITTILTYPAAKRQSDRIVNEVVNRQSLRAHKLVNKSPWFVVGIRNDEEGGFEYYIATPDRSHDVLQVNTRQSNYSAYQKLQLGQNISFVLHQPNHPSTLTDVSEYVSPKGP